jgi:hypothetical protein
VGQFSKVYLQLVIPTQNKTNMERNHFCSVRAYSSSSADMAEPEPKHHATFIPENVIKYDETL